MSKPVNNNPSARTVRRQRWHSLKIQKKTRIPCDSSEPNSQENLVKSRFRLKLEENLRFAIGELFARGLCQDANWLRELHASLKRTLDAENGTQPIFDEKSATLYDIYDADVLDDFRINFSLPESSNYSSHAHCYAKDLFEARDFGRAYKFLSKKGSTESNLFRFLWGYSWFLAGESHTPFQDITERISERSLEPNSALKSIWDHFHSLFCKNRSNMEKGVPRMDPFCLYLLGIVAVKLGNYHVAQEALLDSIKLFPYNWSAWVELGNSIMTQTEYLKIMKKVPMCIMREFFWMHMDPKFNFAQDKLDQHAIILVGLFPDSQTVLQKGVALYYYSDHTLALQLFESVYSKDKYILDYADIYSHILFVLKDNVRLNQFAERCFGLGGLRPEIYCAIGNSHAAEKNYTEAISYFCKAIKLDHSFQSAWIFAGDSFMMLGNPMDAFRTYIIANLLSPNDYHACFCMASIYESSGIHEKASYFYSKANSIRPKTPKV